MEFYVKCIKDLRHYEPWYETEPFTEGKTYLWRDGHLIDDTGYLWHNLATSQNPAEWELSCVFEKINKTIKNNNNNHQEKKITIKTKDNKVIAKMGNKTGVAKCSPEDEFDYYTGVRIAIDRLFGKEVSLEKGNQIKVGDVVRITNSEKAYDIYTRWFEKKQHSY